MAPPGPPTPPALISQALTVEENGSKGAKEQVLNLQSTEERNPKMAAPPSKKAKTGAVIYNDGLTLEEKVPSDIAIAQVNRPDPYGAMQ
jgi:hypothetical protein